MCTCANPSSAATRPGPCRTTVRQVKRLSRDRKSVSDPLLETLLYPPCIKYYFYSEYKFGINVYLYCKCVFTGVTGLTKPVPPPKPAKSPQNYQQAPGPPPYRMPPYPLYNESTPLPGTSNKIHTHSSKFPVSQTIYLNFKANGLFFLLPWEHRHNAWEFFPGSLGKVAVQYHCV